MRGAGEEDVEGKGERESLTGALGRTGFKAGETDLRDTEEEPGDGVSCCVRRECAAGNQGELRPVSSRGPGPGGGRAGQAERMPGDKLGWGRVTGRV